MKIFRKISGLLTAMLLTTTLCFAAWPSAGARTKTWGAEVLTANDLHGQFDLIWTYINAFLNSSTGHAHTGATGQGPKLNIAAALTIASQAQGDVIYASTATAWARLGAGTSGQFLMTKGTSANPQWSNVVVTNYRREMFCTQASATTMTVSPGELEVNGNSVATTSATTLTLTTAGNWAGGSSLQATSTYGYIGVDSSGNIKMHTTAPSNCEYGLTTTAGIKRYASWSSTTYRIIGWFYMNSTGSGQLNSYEVGNLKDSGVYNKVFQSASSTSTINSGTYAAMNASTFHYYSSGRPVTYNATVHYSRNAADNYLNMVVNLDTSDQTVSQMKNSTSSPDNLDQSLVTFFTSTPSQGVHTYLLDVKLDTASNTDLKERITTVTED